MSTKKRQQEKEPRLHGLHQEFQSRFSLKENCARSSHQNKLQKETTEPAG
jgi:hypothetical protein